MDTGGMTLATWSFLAAALAYALVFGRVAHLGFLAAPRIVEQVTVAIAFAATASWAVIECVTGAWLNLPWLQLAARAADAARYLRENGREAYEFNAPYSGESLDEAANEGAPEAHEE